MSDFEHNVRSRKIQKIHKNNITPKNTQYSEIYPGKILVRPKRKRQKMVENLTDQFSLDFYFIIYRTYQSQRFKKSRVLPDENPWTVKDEEHDYRHNQHNRKMTVLLLLVESVSSHLRA